MLQLETKGSWREMGRQLGEAFRGPIHELVERYASWVEGEAETWRPAIAYLTEVLGRHCPDLLEEARGVGEGAGLKAEFVVGQRFFNHIRSYLETGCSVVFMDSPTDGPLLGRNCDLSAAEAPLQLCQVRRPSGQPASIITTYVGLANSEGMSETGVALMGASAAARPAPSVEGLPAPALSHLVLHQCHSVAEARALLARCQYRGKGQNTLAGDREGDSTLFEYVAGGPVRGLDRPPGRRWQGATNFLLSGAVPIEGNTSLLPNSYARYGRIVHQLERGLAQLSLRGMQRLLGDIAQPGLCCPQDSGCALTVYSHVMDVRGGKMWLCPDHPGRGEWRGVAL